MSFVYRRDPILQINVQVSDPKPCKSAVPSYMKITNWLENKPRGIGRGQFFSQAEGSYRVNREDNSAFKPTKKVYSVIPPYSYEKPEGTKKIVVPNSRDPILNPDKDSKISGKKIKNTAFATSGRLSYENSMDSGIKQETFLKRNTSHVFDDKRNVESTSQRKRMQERPSSTADLLRYQYALPFRDEKVTKKIM